MPPRVSIVTSSFNQAGFIARTIESIRAQDYPHIEHIVVDGMSTDDTVDVLARYPHLRIIREPDRGQADAINKGFRIATGDIFAFVNSDDTLEPGAVSAVVQAMNPATGHSVVMGRCRFIDEHDRFLGVEHPSAFVDHRRVLEIWKGHCLPQPAVFWTREVWETSGPLEVGEQLVLDYDLFCRMSRDYRFHTIDQVLANYRLHAASKTTAVTDAERLEQAIAVSRRYWGPALSPMGLQVRASYLAFRLNRRGRAVGMMRTGRLQLGDGRYVAGAARLAAGALLAPEVAADVALMPTVKPLLRRLAARRPGRARPKTISPQTRAYLSGTDLYADNWAGPEVTLVRDAQDGATTLVLRGHTPLRGLETPLRLEAFVDGDSLGALVVAAGPDFELCWTCRPRPAGPRRVHLKASSFMVPHDHLGTADFRPLSFQLTSLDFAAR